MNDFLNEWGSRLLATGVLGAGTFMYRMAYRLEVLERLFKDKKETLDGVATMSASHEKRLAVVESVITELKSLIPALQNITSLTTKVEALLEHSSKRLERLEEHVYGLK